MKYNVDTINGLYEDNLAQALKGLSLLPVAKGGKKPNIRSLNGWVYEQTIRHCLSEELKAIGLPHTKIEEQVALYGRVKIDLLVGKAAIEVKVAGSFGGDDKKYAYYRAKVEEKGWIYCYLTGGESCKKYRVATIGTFKKNAFFLDTDGDWQKFVKKVADNCEEKS